MGGTSNIHYLKASFNFLCLFLFIASTFTCRKGLITFLVVFNERRYMLINNEIQAAVPKRSSKAVEFLTDVVINNSKDNWGNKQIEIFIMLSGSNHSNEGRSYYQEWNIPR